MINLKQPLSDTSQPVSPPLLADRAWQRHVGHCSHSLCVERQGGGVAVATSLQERASRRSEIWCLLIVWLRFQVRIHLQKEELVRFKGNQAYQASCGRASKSEELEQKKPVRVHHV